MILNLCTLLGTPSRNNGLPEGAVCSLMLIFLIIGFVGESVWTLRMTIQLINQLTRKRNNSTGNTLNTLTMT